MADNKDSESLHFISKEPLIEKITALEAENACLKATLSTNTLLDGLIDLNPSPILITDHKGHPVRTNQAMIDILGAEPPQDYSIFEDPILDRLNLLGTLRELQNGKTVKLPSFPYNTHDVYENFPDKPVYLKLIAFPLSSEKDRILSYVVILEDVTAQVKAEESIIHNQHYLQAVLDSLSDSIFVDDAATGNIIDVNKTTCDMYGYTREEMLQLQISDLSFDSPDYSQEEALRHLNNSRTGEPQVFEWLARHKNGNSFWVEVSIRYAIIADAERFIVSVRDISERKFAEKALEESEERYRRLTEDMPAFICTFLPDSTLTFANTEYCSFFGKKPNDIIGKPFLNLIPTEEIRKEAIGHYMSLTPEIPVSSFENPVTNSDGHSFWHRLVTRAFFNSDGEVTFFQSVGIDITERILTEQALAKSEERYRRLADDMPALLCTFLPDSTLTYANPAYCNYFRSKPKELLGKQFADFLPTDGDRQATMAQYLSLTPDNPVKSYEHPVSAPDGKTVWQRWIERAFFDEEKNIVFLQAIGIDITERILAEQALLESERKFRTLFDSISDAVLLVEIESCQILEANAATTQLYGYSHAELICLKNYMLSAEPEATRLATQEERNNVPLRFHKKSDGTVFPVEIHSGIFNYKGKRVHIAAIHDITERLQLENEKIEMERRLLHAQKLESLGVLAGGIAHDFNNLLLAVLGNLDLAMIDLPPESVARHTIKQAMHAAQRAADLTRQMLAYSGRGKFVINKLNLNGLVQENVHMLRAAMSKTVNIEFFLGDDSPTIEADASQVQQVIMNLITNAAEAIGNKPGIVSLSTGSRFFDMADIEKSLTQEKPEPGEYVWLEVSDTGTGMTDQTLSRLFDPFFTTKFTGRGLGMSAVQGILQGHKGAIMVDSMIGRGTRIKVMFPTSPTTDKVSINSSLSSEVQELTIKSVAPGGILIVDDEEMVRGLCKNMAERLGFEAYLAEDGDVALVVYQKHLPDITCVILDVTMPNLDGIATFHELNKINPDVRVIMSSGYNEDDVFKRFGDKRPVGFIQKPYPMEAFKTEIERILAL